MKFTELTDKQWEHDGTTSARTGRPRCNDRKTINGIIFVLVTGCRWDEMPERYGSKSTAHLRLQRWQQKGIWKDILSCAIKFAHKAGKMNLQKISADSSSIPAKKEEM